MKLIIVTSSTVLAAVLAIVAKLPGTNAYTPQQCALYQLIFMSNFARRLVGTTSQLGFGAYIQLRGVGTAYPSLDAMETYTNCFLSVPVQVRYFDGTQWDNGEYNPNPNQFPPGQYQNTQWVRMREATAGVYSKRTCFEISDTYGGSTSTGVSLRTGNTPPGASLTLGNMAWYVNRHLKTLFNDQNRFNPGSTTPYLCINPNNRRNLLRSGSNSESGFHNETLALEENEDFKEALLAWGVIDESDGVLANMTDEEFKGWIKAMNDPSN